MKENGIAKNLKGVVMTEDDGAQNGTSTGTDEGSFPSMPDERLSRGDGRKSDSRRDSKSHRHGSKKGRRRSSTTNSPRRSSKSERSPTRRRGERSPSGASKGDSDRGRSSTSKKPETSKSERSPTHSPHRASERRRSSTSKKPESSKSQTKLRMATGSEGIRSPTLLSYTDGALTSSEKGNNDSRQSGRRSSKYKNPHSKGGKDRTSMLRMAEPGAVAAPSELQGPPTSSATGPAGKSKLRAARTGGVTAPSDLQGPVTPIPRRARRSKPGSTNVATSSASTDNDPFGGATPIQATVAPNVNEIEAARLQGREEGRHERDKERQERSPNDNLVFVAAPAPINDNSAKKYAFAAFVIAVIAAAIIVVWQVLTNRNSAEPAPITPPTPEDCLNTSQGLLVEGQNETSVRTFAVEINFAMSPDMSDIEMTLFKTELEIRTQRYVLPLLIGCQIDGPIIIENNNFVIKNALMETISITPHETGCNLTGSESPVCSLVYMEMDLFLKDPEVSSDYILELIAFLFQHKDLLELLDLSTPVDALETQREYEVLATPVPSSLPSFSPTDKPVQDLPMPSKEECLNISEGVSADNEDLVLQEYDIYMDVMLDELLEDLTDITDELEDKLQQLLMPLLAGCDPSFFLDDDTAPDGVVGDLGDTITTSSTNLGNTQTRRHLVTEGLVLNALVEAEYLIDGLCLAESDPPCYRYVIHLDIFVKSIAASADFTEPLMTKFREEPLVKRLGLQVPFVEITIVETVAQTPSAMPSFSPSANPTTPAPSQEPSALPSESPSQIPSSSPTPQPTPGPTQTPPPTPGPTAFPTQTPPPTPGPTAYPTDSTRAPSSTPTLRPTMQPTAVHVIRPILPGPTDGSTPTPTIHPTSGPSDQPTPTPTNRPTTTPTTISPTMTPTRWPTRKPTPLPTKPPTLLYNGQPCTSSSQCQSNCCVLYVFGTDVCDNNGIFIYCIT